MIALIRYNHHFDDPMQPGEVNVVVTIAGVLCGAEVSIVQSGLPEAIRVEMCYLGWQESLEQLRDLVETNLPG